MIFINVSPGYKGFLNKSILRKTAQLVLNNIADAHTYDVTIAVVNNKTIQELNNKYRSQDKPTDVLTFGFRDQNPENENTYLGDIIISYETAQDHSASSSHSTEEELQLLTVHGMLHLLDYGHENNKDKQIMWQAQSEILNKLGLSHINQPK
jgi:probable rRNA maturation factor